jgi:hypothetical protein
LPCILATWRNYVSQGSTSKDHWNQTLAIHSNIDDRVPLTLVVSGVLENDLSMQIRTLVAALVPSTLRATPTQHCHFFPQNSVSSIKVRPTSTPGLYLAPTSQHHCYALSWGVLTMMSTETLRNVSEAELGRSEPKGSNSVLRSESITSDHPIAHFTQRR